MRAIKKINNNVALCIDRNGKELLARGKGIGFHSFPYELNLKDIERTYYDVDETYISMIDDIPEEILDISTEIIDKARETIENSISSNIVFTLADHINFCIERYKKNLSITLPIVRDIEFLFEEEMKVGEYGLKLIRERLNQNLPKEEAAYIALHIINAEEQNKNKQGIDSDAVINEITGIIENEYEIRINRENFNYSRFVSHMHYLFKRGQSKHLVQSGNDRLYRTTKEDYPKTYQCSEKVSDYLKKKMNLDLTDEEKLYLMLHINRLCTREDCYQ